MDRAERARLLTRGRTGPLWPGEPLLGGYYTEEGIDAATAAIRSSLDPTVGFGFSSPAIEEFEAAFAAYYGTRKCISLNGAGADLDIAMVLPRSEELGARLFCVPIHPCMTAEDNAYICAALWAATEQLAREE